MNLHQQSPPAPVIRVIKTRKLVDFVLHYLADDVHGPTTHGPELDFRILLRRIITTYYCDYWNGLHFSPGGSDPLPVQGGSGTSGESGRLILVAHTCIE
jgi:hypothetical protein